MGSNKLFDGPARRPKKNERAGAQAQGRSFLEDFNKSFSGESFITGFLSGLKISQPGDAGEQLAEKAAEALSTGSMSLAQNAAHENLWLASPEPETADPYFEQLLKSSIGQGKAIEEDLKAEMEQKLNADFSEVRIHDDETADELCGMINARAFTYGNDIYFARGEYNPNYIDGKKLLAHELTHVVQQQNTKAEKRIQKMDDPTVIEDRRKYRGMTIKEITKSLGYGYELESLQKLFFGSLSGNLPAWRNLIIKYYLLERGWEYAKDSPPSWAEYKYVIDDESKEVLVVYTPIPGQLGAEAAFGFVRWDLKLNPTQIFYRYQANKADFDAVNDITKLKEHEKENKNVLSGTKTKLESVFDDATYKPAEPKTAILLAYNLVDDFQKSSYINNPGINSKPSKLSHQEYISLESLLESSYTWQFGQITNHKLSRRDFFVKSENKSFSGNDQLSGFKITKPEDASMLAAGTTLGLAKRKYIDSDDVYTKGSIYELDEEGIAANVLIKHFSRFKEGVGKIVFFLEAYGAINPTAKSIAISALNGYKATIINAYLYPEEKVDFSNSDKVMDGAYQSMFSTIYGEGGVFDMRYKLAKEALSKLSTDKSYNSVPLINEYITSALKETKPQMPKGGGDIAQVNLKPVAKMETAIGMIDILAQIAMFKSCFDAHISLTNSHNYYNTFNEFALRLNGVLGLKENGYEKKLVQIIDEARAVIAAPDYGQKLKVDLFLDEVERKMTRAQMELLMIGAVVVSFWAGGVLGSLVGNLARGFLAGSSLSSTATAIIAGSVEVVAAALATTLLQETLMSGLTSEKWGKNFSKELLINTLLFGAGKLFEVIYVSRYRASSEAIKLGEGIWKEMVNGKPVFYIDRSLAVGFETTEAVAEGSTSLLTAYPTVRAELSQVQNILKSAGKDPYLIENALRKSDKLVLEYFEKNPGKLSNVAELLPKMPISGQSLLNQIKGTQLLLDEVSKGLMTGDRLWGLWSQYSKQLIDGEEVAIVNSRLYSRNAVEATLPSGLGGQGITPSVVNDVIVNGEKLEIGNLFRYNLNNVYVMVDSGTGVIRSIRVNKVFSIIDLKINPSQIFGYLDTQLHDILISEGWQKGTYSGTSNASVYFKHTRSGRSEIVFNYGEGIHSGGRSFSSPYYYKLEGPEFGKKTRIIDVQTYPDLANAINNETYRLIDGPTGRIIKP